MYFASRHQAGRMLATKLVNKYRYENCAVLAIDDGGVMVGLEIARQLHCVLTLLNMAEINLPREPLSLAGMTASGALAYNPQYQKGDLDEMLSEYRGFIEEEKQRQMHKLNHIIGNVGTVNKKLLSGHNIIVVSDGLRSAFEVDLCFEFLKPIKIEKLIFAIPFASVPAVDRMHVLGDELVCLDVYEEFMEVNHYYDKHDIPSHEKILETLSQIVLKWR